MADTVSLARANFIVPTVRDRHFHVPCPAIPTAPGTDTSGCQARAPCRHRVDHSERRAYILQLVVWTYQHRAGFQVNQLMLNAHDQRPPGTTPIESAVGSGKDLINLKNNNLRELSAGTHALHLRWAPHTWASVQIIQAHFIHADCRKIDSSPEHPIAAEQLGQYQLVGIEGGRVAQNRRSRGGAKG